MRLEYTLCSLALLWSAALCLKIGTFNIQRFGVTKASKTDVMTAISKIIRRYDLILIMEIKDKSGTALEALKRQLPEYEFTVSDRLGDSSQKEQYAFLYKPSSGLQIIKTYQDTDVEDYFSRPPFSVLVESKRTGIKEFALIGIHTKPDSAVMEINALKTVAEYVEKLWNVNDVLVMGDLNADCSYVSKKKLPMLDFRQAGDYHWLIGDEVDTTVRESTDCAYDRFIMKGEKFLRSYIKGSAKPFDFSILTETEPLSISDHYPIELELLSNVGVRDEL